MDSWTVRLIVIEVQAHPTVTSHDLHTVTTGDHAVIAVFCILHHDHTATTLLYAHGTCTLHTNQQHWQQQRPELVTTTAHSIRRD